MKSVRISRLNDRGLAQMADLLEVIDKDPSGSIDEVASILMGIDTTSSTPNIVQADADLVFSRRYDIAAYLTNLIPRLGLLDPTRDRGLWAWLALLWFAQLAPMRKGTRKVGERAKWIPEGGWKYYRHLVLGPYLCLSSNADQPRRALAVLHNPPHTPGELVGQLAATQDIAQSRAAIGAATMLYYDTRNETMKRGSGGSGPGSPRRYRTVLDQLDRTFDLQSATEEQLLGLLPPEFDRFKRNDERGG